MIQLIAMYAIYRIFTNTEFARKITSALREQIVKKEIIKPVSFERLVNVTGGYGVSQKKIAKDSPIVDKTLYESNLRKLDISGLVIEEEGDTVPNPPPDKKIF